MSASAVSPSSGARSEPDATLAFAALAFLVLALQFGPLIGLIGFQLNNNPLWALNGAVRDATVFALLALASVSMATAARRAGLPRSAHWALGTVAVFAGFALVSSTNPFVLALNLRRLALMPLLYVTILLIPWSPAQVDRLFRWIVGSCAAVAVFGVFERLAPEAFWTDVLDVASYTAANGFDRFGTVPFEHSGRFFTGDLESWTGGPVRRMVSSYLEPTTLAAAMSVLLVVASARGARGHRGGPLVLLALACGAATVSKGFVLFVLVLLAWRLAGVPSPRHVLALSAAACAAALAGESLLSHGSLAHATGLTSALQHLAAGHLWGDGIGNAGNYTNSDFDVGEESGFGNTVGQVGLAALLPLIWVATMSRDVLRAAATRRDPGGPWLAAWTLFWAVSYLGSASSLGVGGNALGFIALALYLHPASGARAR